MGNTKEEDDKKSATAGSVDDGQKDGVTIKKIKKKILKII